MIFKWKKNKVVDVSDSSFRDGQLKTLKVTEEWTGNWNGKGTFLKFESERQLLPFVIGVNGRFGNFSTPAYVRSLQSIGINIHQRRANKSINLWVIGEPGTHAKTKDKFINEDTLLINYKDLINLDSICSEGVYDDLFPAGLKRLEPLPDPVFKRVIKRNRPHIQMRNDLYECVCVVCRGKFETTHPSKMTCTKCV